MKKTIEYYRKNSYGQTREYVKNKGDSDIIERLTGKRTIDSVTRELFRDLMGGNITWVEVLAPK